MAAVAKRGHGGGKGAHSTAQMFREMERQGGAGGGSNTIDVRSHRQKIMNLRKMNEIIAQELATETKLAAVNNSSTAAAKLATLREQKEMYQNKIATEKLRITEMDTQLDSMRKAILEKKKQIGGEHAAAENHRSIQKRIKVLENRLDKSLIRFNEEQTRNNKLETQIKNLRTEQQIAEKMHAKLEKELASKKDQMQTIIEEAEEAFAAREAAQEAIQQLKTGAESEQKQFENEWGQLDTMVQHDRTQKRGFAPIGLEDPEEEPEDMEEQLKRQVVREHWRIAFEHAKQEVSLKKVHLYEDAFARIKEVTGIQEVDELVESFIASEEQYNSLVNLINALGLEVQGVEKEVQDIRRSAQKIRSGAANNIESLRLRVLEDLKDKLDKSDAKTQHFKDKHSASASTISELIPGVAQVFEMLGCKEMASAGKIAGEDLKAETFLKFCEVIEEKALDKLQTYAKNRADELGMHVDQLLVSRPFTDTGSAAVWDIVPPTIDDDTILEEDHEELVGGSDVPLTRTELEMKARASVSKRTGLMAADE